MLEVRELKLSGDDLLLFVGVRNRCAPNLAISCDAVAAASSGASQRETHRFGAFVDSTCVGVSWHTSPSAYLSVGVGVLAGFRRNGVGRLLADRVAACDALSSGPPPFAFDVDHDDPRSVRFARRRGFQVLETGPGWSFAFDGPAAEAHWPPNTRRVITDDLDDPRFVANLLTIMHIADEPHPDVEPMTLPQFVATERLRINTGGVTIVATRGSHLLGATFASRSYAIDQIYSDFTLVPADGRGRGVGGVLKTAQLAWAYEQRIARIVTDVPARAVAMQRILRARGFREWSRAAMQPPVSA